MVADPADPVVTSSRSEERDARTPEWREMAGNLPLSRRETIYAGWCEACGVEADPVYRICEACREKYLCVEPAPSPADQGLRAALLQDLAAVYTVDTDQAALIRLVQRAKELV